MPLVCQLPRIHPADAVRQEVLAMAERQLVDVVGDEALRDVGGRDATAKDPGCTG